MKAPATKRWWQSKTIIGAVAVIMAAVSANLFGTEIDHATLVDKITDATLYAGALLSILGRVKAEGKITAKDPAPDDDA